MNRMNKGGVLFDSTPPPVAEMKKSSLDDYEQTPANLLGTSASDMQDHRPKQEDRQPIEYLLPSSGSVINPNAEDILRRVSVVVVNHIATAERKLLQRLVQAKHFGMAAPKQNVSSADFSEHHFVKAQWRYMYCDDIPGDIFGTSFSLEKCSPKHKIPDAKMVYEFMRKLFVNARLSAECSVVCLIYVERLMKLSGLRLYRYNWRPVMLCGLLLASKIWQDMAAWNIEFSNIYTQFSLKNINKLERMFVQRLDWKLVVTGGEYAKFYFTLRSMNARKDFRRKYISTLGGGRQRPPQAAETIYKLSKQAAQVFSRSLPK
eukprot:g6376.t1